MDTIVIVNGSTFIGAQFACYLSDKYNDIRIVIVDKSGDRQNLKSIIDSIIYEKVDAANTTEIQSVFNSYNPNLVLNIEDGNEHPDTKSQYNIIDCCSNLGIDRLVHISSGRVYGPYRRRSFETDPINPKDEHSIAMLTAENIIRSMSLLKNLPTIILRLSNVYGEKQKSGVIHDLVTAAINSDFLMLPYDGKIARDWIHIDDCCTAIDRALYFGENHETYNIGSGHATVDGDLARSILSHFNLPFSMIDYDDNSLSHACETVLDIGKIKKLSWTPTLELDDKLPFVIKSYIRHNKDGG